MPHGSEEDSTRREHPEEDSTRRESPEQAQAQHEAVDVPKPAGATRRTRMRQLGAVAAIVMAAVAVILVTTGANGNSPPRPGTVRAIKQEISALLTGIPQAADALGRPTAPVTLQWFGDLQCPFCKKFTLGALTPIIRKWVRGGQLRIEYLSMETATHEPEVFKKQQVAALAAGMQDKLWYFVESFYREQGEEDSGYVTDSYLQGLARQIPGLKLSLWAEDRFDPELVNQIDTDRQTVKSKHLRGTPSFLIGRTGGAMYKLNPNSLTSTKLFDEAVEYLET